MKHGKGNNMPVNVQLNNYTLDSVITEDTYLTHYNALNAKVEKFIITEFAPIFMIKRTEEGVMDVEARFSEEFYRSHEKFRLLADSLRELNEDAIPKVEDILQENNTVYIVRQVIDHPTQVNFITDKQMTCSEAYLFMRPLIISLTKAERFDLHFRLTNENLFINRYGQLVLNEIFIWDGDYRLTIQDIVNLLFCLVYGKPYEAKLDSEFDKSLVPSKLFDIMVEIYSGDVMYGSIDDFYKKIKSLIPIKTARAEDGTETQTSYFKVLVAGLSVLLVFAFIFLFVFNVMIPVMNRANPRIADDQVFASLPQEVAGSRTRNFSLVSFTAPRNSSDILNGSFHFVDGVRYFRGFSNGYKLMTESGGASENTLLTDVRPAFITVTGGFVYFADGLRDYHIYRVAADGTGLTRLAEHCASYVHIDGNYMYYTNHDDLDRLYRLDLNTLETSRYMQNAAYYAVTNGGRLFFINGSDDFNLYSSEENRDGEIVLTRLTDSSADNLILYNGLLYYIDIADNRLNVVRLDGAPAGINCPYSMHSFAISGDWVIYIDNNSFYLNAYNFTTEERVTINNSYQHAYVSVTGGEIFAIDYNNSRESRRFALP